MEKGKKDLRQAVLKLFKEKTKKECYEIKIIRKKGQEPSILDDKVGGNPYLPKNEAYPIGKSSGDPLPLLLQLNLSHIKLPGYPNKGILEIFMDNKGYPTDYEIKYFKTVDEKNYQKEFPKLNFDTKNPLYFEKGFKIKLIKTYDYMYSLDYRFNELLLSIVNKVYGLKLKELDDFEEDDDDVWEEYIHNNIKGLECTFGGYPDFTQQDPRESDVKKEMSAFLKWNQ